MDGGDEMKKGRTVYIEAVNTDYAGYSLTIVAGGSTSQVGGIQLAPIQGVPYSHVSSGEESRQYIFPESREERFLDNNLLEFYKKKGYSLAGNKDA